MALEFQMKSFAVSWHLGLYMIRLRQRRYNDSYRIIRNKSGKYLRRLRRQLAQHSSTPRIEKCTPRTRHEHTHRISISNRRRYGPLVPSLPSLPYHHLRLKSAFELERPMPVDLLSLIAPPRLALALPRIFTLRRLKRPICLKPCQSAPSYLRECEALPKISTARVLAKSRRDGDSEIRRTACKVILEIAGNVGCFEVGIEWRQGKQCRVIDTGRLVQRISNCF